METSGRFGHANVPCAALPGAPEFLRQTGEEGQQGKEANNRVHIRAPCLRALWSGQVTSLSVPRLWHLRMGDNKSSSLVGFLARINALIHVKYWLAYK